MTSIHQTVKLGRKGARKFCVLPFGLILITLVTACCANGTEPTWPVSPPSTCATTGFPCRFHVEGNTFVDEAGRKMVFRGMAPIDPLFQILHSPEHGMWSEQHYQVMAEWGANIIRVPIVPYTVRRYIDEYGSMDDVLSVIDQTIAWAAENKMYVIIDFHSVGWPPDNFYPPNVGSETTCDEIIAFWDTISEHYKDNHVVAFYELFNEPGRSDDDYSGSLADWMIHKEYAERLIQVIRVNDPDKIVLVGGMQFAYDLSHAADAPIEDSIEDSNIAYAVHPYSHLMTNPDQPLTDWDTHFGDLSHSYAVFATELGYDECYVLDPDYNGVPYHQAIIDYLEAHGMSWTVWVFDDCWGTALLLDIQTYKPSPSGRYFRKRMLALNYPDGKPPELGLTPFPTFPPASTPEVDATSYEAEQGSLSGTAQRACCPLSTCSGDENERVIGIGNGEDNFVEINVNVPISGDYTLIIYYLLEDSRSLFVSVNGGAPTELELARHCPSKVFSTTMSVALNAGDNMIKFHNDSGEAPDLDRITIH